MSVKQHLSDIIAASILDHLDDKGKQELSEWLNEKHSNRDFYESIKNSFSSEEILLELSSYDSVKGWIRVKQKAARNRRRLLYKRTSYAAITAGVLVLFSVLFIPYINNDNTAVNAITDTLVLNNRTAVLVLPDGNTIDLKNEIELSDGKIKNDGVVLEYKPEQLEEAPKAKPETHTIRVPRGAEYKVVLADGSTVHLNADSEFRYPAYFDGKNRTVELSGEAYFDIAPDAEKPFVIENIGMSLTVLGTSFNFRAYEGGQRRVTIEDGLVLIRLGNAQLEAGAGFQVCETEDGLFSKEVDTSADTSWRNNRFVFNSENLGDALMEIERWYDIKVRFSDDRLKELKLTADLPKYESINKLIDIINQAVYVNIRRDGNELIVNNE